MIDPKTVYANKEPNFKWSYGENISVREKKARENILRQQTMNTVSTVPVSSVHLGWLTFTQGNMYAREGFLLLVCNYMYTSYKNPQKLSLPNPFAREKVEDMAGSMPGKTSLHSFVVITVFLVTFPTLCTLHLRLTGIT